MQVISITVSFPPGTSITQTTNSSAPYRQIRSHLAMLERYVLPIDYYYVNLLITDWSEPDFAGVSFNDLFDRLYALRFRCQPDASDYAQDENTGTFRIPSAEFERVILPISRFPPKSSARWPVTTSRRTPTRGVRSGQTTWSFTTILPLSPISPMSARIRMEQRRFSFRAFQLTFRTTASSRTN